VAGNASFYIKSRKLVPGKIKVHEEEHKGRGMIFLAIALYRRFTPQPLLFNLGGISDEEKEV
jgi:hypothetical protein